MKEIILTKHAIERMQLRNVSKSQVENTVNKYTSTKLEDDGDTRFIKAFKRGGVSREINVVAKPTANHGKDIWLIKTVWVDGEQDPNFITRIFQALLRRIFGKKAV